MYQIEIADKAKKKLLKLPHNWQRKISKMIYGISIDPYIGKKLHGNLEGQYVVRAWPCRIIYTIDNYHIIVSVLDIGHRKDIYRKG